MPGSNDDFKARVLDATDIVELIGRSVALKRRGKDYVGLCPFHQEKSPSFSVSPGKRMFYCYGCKTGGDAITFVMKRDRIEFLDALRQLGDQAGLEMPRHGVSKQKSGEKQALLDMQSGGMRLLREVAGPSPAGSAARAYLAKRQINAESIQRFQIGYAPDAWEACLRSGGPQVSAPQLLAIGGLVSPVRKARGTTMSSAIV